MMNKRKIIIITSKFLHVFVQHIIDELPLDCDVEIVEYKCFQDIKQIYQQYESTSDGFMLSGKAALAALEKHFLIIGNPRFLSVPIWFLCIDCC